VCPECEQRLNRKGENDVLRWLGRSHLVELCRGTKILTNRS
jgi:hypothetical protein